MICEPHHSLYLASSLVMRVQEELPDLIVSDVSTQHCEIDLATGNGLIAIIIEIFEKEGGEDGHKIN